MNPYFKVFYESTLAAGLFPFAHEPAFFAMRGFGGYNMPLAATLAVLGAALGTTFTFIIGVYISKIYRKKNGSKQLSTEKYNKASRSFSRYFTILFPFTWLPLVNFLPLVAGFLGLRAKTVLSLVIAGKIAYYGYWVMY